MQGESSGTAEIKIRYLGGRKNWGKSWNHSLLLKIFFLSSIPNFVCLGEGTGEEIY